MLDLEKVADLVEVVGPSRIGAVSAKERLGVGPATARHRFDVGDGFAATRDRVPLAVVFDGVEEVGEPAGRFGGGDFGHGIRLSDFMSGRKGVDPLAAPPVSPLPIAPVAAHSGVRTGAAERARASPQEVRMVRKKRDEIDVTVPISPNQIVAFNLSEARALRGWTQEQAAAELEKYIGARWSKATFSAAERSIDGRRVRQFTADEIVAFSRCFGVPIGFFFMPPRPSQSENSVNFAAPERHGYGIPLTELLDVIFGTPGEREVLSTRLNEYLGEIPMQRSHRRAGCVDVAGRGCAHCCGDEAARQVRGVGEVPDRAVSSTPPLADTGEGSGDPRDPRTRRVTMADDELQRKRGNSKPNVKRRGSTYTYYLYVTGPDGKRHQHSKGGFKTQREAEDARIAAEYTLATGTYVKAERISRRRLPRRRVAAVPPAAGARGEHVALVRPDTSGCT